MHVQMNQILTIPTGLQCVHSHDAYFALHKLVDRTYIQSNEIGSPRAGLGNTKDTEMNVARTFNNWRKYRQTRNELARMSDRELSDIGVSRADIARIARQAI